MCYNKTQAFYYKSKCLAHTFTFGELRAYRQIMPQPGGYGIMKTQAFYYKFKCLAHTFTFGELYSYCQIITYHYGYAIINTTSDLAWYIGKGDIMFCMNCGAQLSDTAKFCGSCGTKVELPDLGVPAAAAASVPANNSAPAETAQPAQSAQPSQAAQTINLSKQASPAQTSGIPAMSAVSAQTAPTVPTAPTAPAAVSYTHLTLPTKA